MLKIDYDLIIKKIKEYKAKRVLIQVPDGLKPKSLEIADKVYEATGVHPVIWFAPSFGACDLPVGADRLGFDLLLHIGHSRS